MATEQSAKKKSPSDREDRQRRSSLIANHVLFTLGRPGNLLTVQVRSLWEDFYRVNVVVGRDTASARIAQSYFLSADGEGNIVTAIPTITKQY